MKICAGTGLVALDVLVKGKSDINPKIFAGGSCGNVLSILSFLDFKSYPIARLGNNDATDLIIEDLDKWKVNSDFIEREINGSTPIIIHRILESRNNEPKHRFEFKNPSNGKWLPSFRPVLAKKVENITTNLPSVDVFYFDRVSRSSIELAKFAKSQGALIFFEPSSNRQEKQFQECLDVCDVVKFSNDRIKTYKDDYPTSRTTLEIETSGKSGLSYRYKSDNWLNLDSFLIGEAVDTAGAGDWCSAGIIHYLISQKDTKFYNFTSQEILEALKYGQVLGALNCLFDGARGLMYQIDKSQLDHTINLVLERKPIDNILPKVKSKIESNFELEVILASS